MVASAVSVFLNTQGGAAIDVVNAEQARIAADAGAEAVMEPERVPADIRAQVEAIIVEQIPSPRQVKHTAALGTRYNLYESSSVPVFLAQLPFAKVEDLATVKAQGFAVNDGFANSEEVGISAIVRDYRDEAVGCITMSAPRSRTGPDRIDAPSGGVLVAARAVSARLGHRPAGPQTSARSGTGRMACPNC